MSNTMSKSIYTLFTITILIHILGASLLPLTQDEAYYLHWSSFPDFGYFDHPPFIAWLMTPGHWIKSPLFARLPSVILAAISFPILHSLCERVGISSVKQKLCALTLFNFNLFGLVFGVIATPDVPLVFFWMMALHEAAAALDSPKRWLSAGFFAGLGLLGKYTMILIGPVFFWALIRKRGGLKSPWPYLGALICILTFSPNILWNLKNDWISYRFQYNRGLKHSHEVENDFKNRLPIASQNVSDPNGLDLAQIYIKNEKKKKTKSPKTSFQKLQRRISDYIAGQVSIWALFLIILVYNRIKKRPIEPLQFRKDQHNLLLASAVIPLGFFGLIALAQKTEANWPAPALVGISLLVTKFFSPSHRQLKGLIITHSLIIIILFIHGYEPRVLALSSRDRILKETYGFNQLSKEIRRFKGPTFADTYQLTSQLSFYNSNQAISQWPGLTRHSEITRRPEMTNYNIESLKSIKRFQLVTTSMRPPRIAGFKVNHLAELRSCLNQTEVIPATVRKYRPKCEDPIHRWFIIQYALE